MIRNETVSVDCRDYLLWLKTQNHADTSPEYLQFDNILDHDEIRIVVPILTSSAAITTKVQNKSSDVERLPMTSTVHSVTVKWNNDWNATCRQHLESTDTGTFKLFTLQ